MRRIAKATAAAADHATQQMLVRMLLSVRPTGLGWRLLMRTWFKYWSWGWHQPRPEVVHGFPVTLPPGHPYPVFAMVNRRYNACLVQLAHSVAGQLHRSIDVVDVGAGIGDTALLLLARNRAEIARLVAVEGEPLFAEMLYGNIGHLDGVDVRRAVVGYPGATVSSVRRTHAGSAVGGSATEAVDGSTEMQTLDELLGDLSRVDVLKLDLEGYDGLVLSGAVRTLRRSRPAVVFEWHPRRYYDAGASLSEPLALLYDNGYETFVWYSMEGEFVAVTDGPEPLHDDVEARELATSRRYYDVVAVPAPWSALVDSLVALADVPVGLGSSR